jgi:hypothetical protein
MRVNTNYFYTHQLYHKPHGVIISDDDPMGLKRFWLKNILDKSDVCKSNWYLFSLIKSYYTV